MQSACGSSIEEPQDKFYESNVMRLFSLYVALGLPTVRLFRTCNRNGIRFYTGLDTNGHLSHVPLVIKSAAKQQFAANSWALSLCCDLLKGRKWAADQRGTALVAKKQAKQRGTA